MPKTKEEQKIQKEIEKKVEEKVAEQVGGKLAEQLEEHVAQQIDEKVSQQVEEQVTHQVAEQVAKEIEKQVEKKVKQRLPKEIVNQFKIIDKKIEKGFSKIQESPPYKNIIYPILVIIGGALFWFGTWRILWDIPELQNGIIPLVAGTVLLIITGAWYSKLVGTGK